MRDGWHGRIVKDGATGTSNIGVIDGGEATNVVTPHLALGRGASHDPQFRRQIVDAFQTAFQRAVATVKNDAGATGKLRFEAQLKYESFKLPDDDPAVATARCGPSPRSASRRAYG